MVLEGDEYDSAFFDKGPKFLHYRPNKVILTSLEFDHADIYRDLEHVKEAFRRLVELIPPYGYLLLSNDYAEATEVSRAARCPVVFYGDGALAHWSASNIKARAGKTEFEPCYNGNSEGVVEVGLIGSHNVKNALAVYAMGKEMGVPDAILKDALATFSGVKRRQEVKGERRGVLVIDDFAHHPTAVKETVDAVKAAYPNRRLWAVFEPRSNTSRRRLFAREFAHALATADRVVIAQVYQPEKIPAEIRLSPTEVAEEINRLSGEPRARCVDRNADVPGLVACEAQAGDIVLVMSNGGFDGVQDRILEALSNEQA